MGFDRAHEGFDLCHRHTIKVPVPTGDPVRLDLIYNIYDGLLADEIAVGNVEEKNTN